MASNTVVRARIDEHIKEEAHVVLAAMGLTVSDAFRIMLTRIARGFTDFARWFTLHQVQTFFVIRGKSNLLFRRVYSRAVDMSTGLRCDQTIALTAPAAIKDYPQHLRRIKFYDAEHDRHLVFLTNNFDLPEQDRRRALDVGSRPHVDINPTEVFGIAGGGIYQREERDPSGARVRRKQAQLCGQHFWARGCFVSAVGRDEESIREYIRHHRGRRQAHRANELMALTCHRKVAQRVGAA